MARKCPICKSGNVSSVVVGEWIHHTCRQCGTEFTERNDQPAKSAPVDIHTWLLLAGVIASLLLFASTVYVVWGPR